MRKILLAAMIANLVSLAACNEPRPARTFVDEDACEDAGMPDSYCDALFPEVEDFFEKKKPKFKPKVAAKVSRPKPSFKKPASSSFRKK